MKTKVTLVLILFFSVSCQKQEVSPFEVLTIQSTSYDLPLNEYGKATLKAFGNGETEVTEETAFYVNGAQITGNVFQPDSEGTYLVKAAYRGQESTEVEIRVGEALNKKVLLEYYTAIGCGLCPWMGLRVDSLHKTNPQVIGYAIHSGDEWAIPGIDDFTLYHRVPGFPGLRTDRGYVRNFHEPTEIVGLIDTIDYLLSRQPPLELAIDSDLNQNSLNVQVKGKFYRAAEEQLYLTVMLIEDKLITNGQANYFSGGEYEDCPFTNQPNPIPVYENHNLLRANISDLFGDPININFTEAGMEVALKTYQLALDNIVNTAEAYVIALVHSKRDDVEVSTVKNTQIVKLGATVGFKE